MSARLLPIFLKAESQKKGGRSATVFFEEATPTAANRPTLRTQEMRRT
jgi:hypothetical protein